MADDIGLQAAVRTAMDAGVQFTKAVQLRKFGEEIKVIQDKEDLLDTEFRSIERKVNRGEWPKMDKFDKLGAECETIAKKLRGTYKDVLKALKEDMKAAKTGDKKKLKLVTEVEDKLDKVGMFLLKQQRRPSAGELTLDLLNRRGNDDGPRRAASVDKKRPGTHLYKEVSHFTDKNKNPELKDLVKNKRRFEDLDEVAESSNKLKSQVDKFTAFMKSPDKAAVEATRKAVADLAPLEKYINEAKTSLDWLDKAIKRAAREMKDSKDVATSLQGSFDKAKEVVERIEEDMAVKGDGKTAAEKFDNAVAKLAK